MVVTVINILPSFFPTKMHLGHASNQQHCKQSIFDLQKNMYHFIGNLFEIWHLIHSCKTSFFQCHKTKQLELQILVPVLKFNAINVAQKLGHAAGIETLRQLFLLVRNEAKYICLTPEIRLDLRRVLHVKGNNLMNTTIISLF